MTRATMKSMTRGDIKRDAEVPSFGNLETATKDDNVSYHVVHDAAGRVVRRDQTTENAPKSVTTDNTTAPPPTPPTLTTSISYFDDESKNLYERGAASMVTTGSSAEQTTMTYAAVGGGGTKIVATDAIRNVTTTSTFDSYGRPTSTITIDGGGTELANERFGYDEGGRLRYHQRHQAGLGDIETRNEYDAPATVVAKTEWDLASRKVTHFDPVVGEDAPVAKQVSTLDPLGRVTGTDRTTTDQS
jgi:hypothetical protein